MWVGIGIFKQLSLTAHGMLVYFLCFYNNHDHHRHHHCDGITGSDERFGTSFLHDLGRRIADVSGKTIPDGAALTGKAQLPMVDSCIGQTVSDPMMSPSVGNFGLGICWLAK